MHIGRGASRGIVPQGRRRRRHQGRARQPPRRPRPRPRFEIAGDDGFTGVVEGGAESEAVGTEGGEGRTVTLRAGSLAVGLREGEDWTAEFSSGGRLLASGPPRAVAPVTGPRWVGERHDAGTLPLYARQGSVLPISSRLDRPESDWADGLTLRCFALVDGEEREVVVPAHDGYDAVVFRVTRRGGALAARATGARGPWALEANGLRAEATGAGAGEAEPLALRLV